MAVAVAAGALAVDASAEDAVVTMAADVVVDAAVAMTAEDAVVVEVVVVVDAVAVAAVAAVTDKRVDKRSQGYGYD